MYKFIFSFIGLLFMTSVAVAQADYFYPTEKSFNPAIPTPEKFLGYPIGSHHTRHDKVVEYIKELGKLSDRVVVKEIGYTIEHRLQQVAIITSPANHQRIDDIRQKHLQQAKGDAGNVPLIIHLGYNVHGNEPSSTESAMLTAYYLTASESEETKKWMNDMVILLDPVYNPDGRDRHTSWANMHKAEALVADPLDREHTEVWPGGRTNHYWFDLNRDWILGIHPESRNRIEFFHTWRPYVMTDHHEMGTNSTFYFDPGMNSSNNPIVPPYLYNVVYPKYGEYFARAMNSIGSQYYTKESYDKLYPGYGSSYVNFYGGAGFLFEQASSRGHLQETRTKDLTFAFTIRNQFTASLATVRASIAEKDMLLKMRRDFYTTTASQAKANPVKAYVFGDAADASRTNAFVNLLRMHRVDVYNVSKTFSANGKTFESGKAFVVPTEQENYLLVRTAFEKDITYVDSLFYDASTWSLVHAFNLPHAEIRGAVTKGELVKENLVKTSAPVTKANYAYVMEFTDYQSHKALYQLLDAKVFVKTAFKPFSLTDNGATKNFGRGSLVIAVVDQKMDADKLYETLQSVSKDCAVDITSVSTGFNTKGPDLGSNANQAVEKPKPLMIIGQGVSGYEAGEAWHLLDQRIGMSITKVDESNLGRVDFTNYNVLVMVGGQYNFSKPNVEKIKAWVQSGGTLITLKSASEWAIKQGLAGKEKLVAVDTTKIAKRADFDEARQIEGAKSVGGSIFQVDLDITNPIGFGFTDRKVSVYRNGTTYIQPSKNPYSTVAQYASNPLIGGYLHASNKSKIANSAAILIVRNGQGKTIMFSDNPNFRGTWYGTNKLFLNALFFGPIINPPAPAGEH
ncbi:MAG: zinc carboxypeptidase [Flammeovirgaceae bacterium]|nr:zinc carboxypeptidase [Flammeovirgaceae bacterium]